MARFKILPYKLGSKSAKLLSQHMAQLLGRKVLRIRSPQRIKPGNIAISWGYYSPANTTVNKPAQVLHARDKVQAFTLMKLHNVPTVEWTTDINAAREWYRGGNIVYERTITTGSHGTGINLRRPEENFNLTQVPLYTKYFKAKGEYRVHVMKGEVIDFARKKKKHGVEGNRYIRSHNNGYVFARDAVRIPDCVKEAAISAVRSLGLDFGAVDILHNEKKDLPAVLEVNTAPGLENRTASAYAHAFVRNYR